MAFAISSLVLGITSVGLSFVLIGGLLGLAGIVVGVAHFWRIGRPWGMAITGLILSMVGVAASIGFGMLYNTVLRNTLSSMSDGGEIQQWVGVQAPDLTVTTLDGQIFKLSDFRGKRVIVDSWATWCGPCILEIPHFNELRREVTEDELALVGISDESESTIRSFLKKNTIQYAIASSQILPAPYSKAYAIPTTFFIDRRGVIQSVLVGYRDFEELKQHSIAADYAGETREAPTQ